MRKNFLQLVAGMLAVTTAFAFSGCAKKFDANKQITVIARESSSGTREAFETVVSDGKTTLLHKNAEGKKVSATKPDAELGKTQFVITQVETDMQAIGYISLGSMSDTVKKVKVNGVEATDENVLNGTYKIQRPFVIMTKKGLAQTELAADFSAFLKSDRMKSICKTEGVVFLEDGNKRANAGETPIAVGTFTPKQSVPEGKITLRGSTSMELVITAAAKEYAKLYNADAGKIFDIQLEGSSVGRNAVLNDEEGSVIGLSSAAVVNDKIDSFNICLDAVAVIVNKKNDIVTDLTLEDLYKIYTKKITKFSELKK